jgi:hypothetical protein
MSVPIRRMALQTPAAASSTIDAFDLEEQDLQVIFCMAHSRIDKGQT